MKSLPEVFADPESRVMRTVLVVDINDSTKMKEDETEATWLTTYAHFFFQVSTVVEEEGGQLVKYLGDGALAIFEDNAENAINAAIRVQEKIARDNENARIKLNCSVGIASGEVIQFSVAEKTDYIGTTVDRAFRLCSAANARAIFIDLHTESDARMGRVHSKVGLASSPRWTAQDYLGEKYRMSLKGFSKPVSYFEIKWSGENYGVSSGYVTTQSEEDGARRRTGGQPGGAKSRPEPAPGEQVDWLPGEVVTWKDIENAFGFIKTKGGESFYFNRSYLFLEDSKVEEGAEVQFQPLEPLPNSKNRRASKILFLGDEIEGRMSRIIAGKGFGFADIDGQAGDTHNLFVLLGMSGEIASGDHIVAEIGENEKGPIGENAKPA